MFFPVCLRPSQPRALAHGDKVASDPIGSRMHGLKELSAPPFQDPSMWKPLSECRPLQSCTQNLIINLRKIKYMGTFLLLYVLSCAPFVFNKITTRLKINFLYLEHSLFCCKILHLSLHWSWQLIPNSSFGIFQNTSLGPKHDLEPHLFRKLYEIEQEAHAALWPQEERPAHTSYPWRASWILLEWPNPALGKKQDPSDDWKLDLNNL